MANGNDFKGGSPWDSPPSGKGGGRNGSGRGGQRPPNIDEVVEKIQKLISKLVPGGKSGGSKPIIFGLILLVVVWAFSGLYRVLPDEQGVVLRFGKFVSTTQPGLNYHIPYPVETVLTPKVTRIAINLLASPSAAATTCFLYASASCKIFAASPRALGITSLA